MKTFDVVSSRIVEIIGFIFCASLEVFEMRKAIVPLMVAAINSGVQLVRESVEVGRAVP